MLSRSQSRIQLPISLLQTACRRLFVIWQAYSLCVQPLFSRHQHIVVGKDQEAYPDSTELYHTVFAAEPSEITHNDTYFHFDTSFSPSHTSGDYQHQKQHQHLNFYDSGLDQHQYMPFGSTPQLPGDHIEQQSVQFPTPAPTRGSSPRAYYHAATMSPADHQTSSYDPGQMFYHPSSMSATLDNINQISEEFEPEFHQDYIPSFNIEAKPKRKYLKRHQAGSLDSIDTLTSQSSLDEFERQRRTQVKVACIHCKKACKKCDDVRPCTRCVRIGFGANCTDAPRKERKKGFKRGPYNKGRRESVESINQEGKVWSPGSHDNINYILVDSGAESSRSYEPPNYLEQRLIQRHASSGSINIDNSLIVPEYHSEGVFEGEQPILYAAHNPQMGGGAQQHHTTTYFQHSDIQYLDHESTHFAGCAYEPSDYFTAEMIHQDSDSLLASEESPSAYYFPHEESESIGLHDHQGEREDDDSASQFVSPMSIFHP